ncbi:MAG: SipW-dependent-type signal peptide-containing protein [Intestinibacillus sp.]
MKKKSIVMLAATVMTTASVAIGGTLAYLTSVDSLKNTFSMGGEGGDGDFSINLTETGLTTNGEWNATNNTYEWSIADGAQIDEGQTYNNVLPNSVLPKNPIVTNTGDFKLWARIQVTIPYDANYYTDVFGTTDADEVADALLTSANVGSGANQFTRTAEIVDGNLVVSYLYNSVLGLGEFTPSAFEEVNIPNLTNEQLDTLAEANGEGGYDFDLPVSAQAIQTDSGYDTVGEAFVAYDGIGTTA